MAKELKDKNSTGSSNPFCFMITLQGLSCQKTVIFYLNCIGKHRMGWAHFSWAINWSSIRGLRSKYASYKVIEWGNGEESLNLYLQKHIVVIEQEEVGNITNKTTQHFNRSLVVWSSHQRLWIGTFRQNIAHKNMSFMRTTSLTTREEEVILRDIQIPNVEQDWKSHCSDGRLEGSEVSRNAPL